jgi:Leucine-rich repeat (LRR) protein
VHKGGTAIKKGRLIGKISGITLVLVIVFGLTGLATLSSPVLADDPVVTFPDPKLEAAIREVKWKPTGDIHQSDLEKSINLNVAGKGISSLTGLEYCINLATLDLSDNRISNISPLSSLTNLTTLDLSDNRISNISPLSSLTNLTTLDLSDNRISNISPLSSLTNLTTLKLDDNRISNILPLSSLTNLSGLDLWNNRISDISPLSSLTNLTWLELGLNRISDISPLVDNIGLGEGGGVGLQYNHLDLTPDSQAMNDIQTLLDRGVNVLYEAPPEGMSPIAAPIMGLLIIPVLVIGGLVSLFQFNPHIFIIVIIAAAAIIGIVIFFYVRTKRRHA